MMGLGTFNDQQRRVIEAEGGFHLVLAPPGCGKTAVLAERIAWAASKGVPLSEMACLTFTNRAARSMRERISKRIGDEAAMTDELFVGNVHRFCLHFLFDNAIVPDNATVIDTDTSISIITDFTGEEELKVLSDNTYRNRYSKVINIQHLMRQLRDGYPNALILHAEEMTRGVVNELCSVFGLEYNRRGMEQLYTQAWHYRGEANPMSAEARSTLEMLYAAAEYERYKKSNDLLDFEDLLLDTYSALTGMVSSSSISSALASSGDVSFRRFSWLQVDEVQDLNPLQLAIIDRITTPEATVVYLGDSQQAIFSFMGAKTDTLTMLKQRCGPGHFYNFFENYRSPQYLLDIFNAYAKYQLGIDPGLLPLTSNKTPCRGGDVVLSESQTNIDEANMVAHTVAQLYTEHPQESIAVVVAFNSDADQVSDALGKLPHFKISGVDFFSTPPVRLLMSHLGVCHSENDFIAWSHVLSGMHVYASNGTARQAVSRMMQLAMTPTDILMYEDSTYLAEYVNAYEQQDIVIFDTETTGLDVLRDDVVQIAAIKMRQGRVVDELNLFCETVREIPTMLGDTPNPLVEEYSRHEHLTHADALGRFVAFAQGCAIMGHNTTYDFQIMENNMRRYAPHLSMQLLWPSYFDTLKMSRLLHPRLPSYKLRNLLVELSLEGTNSHLANDDILATRSLAVHCYEMSRALVGRQMEFLSRHRSMAQKLRSAYSPLYAHTRQLLYEEAQPDVLTRELDYVYRVLLQRNIISELPKLRYLLDYVTVEMLAGDAADGGVETHSVTLAQILDRHYSDLCTLKEADLCGSSSMAERVFVSTVHKAKGLEFDTVVLYDAVDGKYPSAYANDQARTAEEARKFYVALTRARRRLLVTYCHNSVSRWGAWHSKVITPFMASLMSFFRPVSRPR